MADRLKDKVATAAGCRSGWGNGKAISVLFSGEGARVFGIDMSSDEA